LGKVFLLKKLLLYEPARLGRGNFGAVTFSQAENKQNDIHQNNNKQNDIQQNNNKQNDIRQNNEKNSSQLNSAQ
jgi:hypothetical protein